MLSCLQLHFMRSSAASYRTTDIYGIPQGDFRSSMALQNEFTFLQFFHQCELHRAWVRDTVQQIYDLSPLAYPAFLVAEWALLISPSIWIYCWFKYEDRSCTCVMSFQPLINRLLPTTVIRSVNEAACSNISKGGWIRAAQRQQIVNERWIKLIEVTKWHEE